MVASVQICACGVSGCPKILKPVLCDPNINNNCILIPSCQTLFPLNPRASKTPVTPPAHQTHPATAPVFARPGPSRVRLVRYVAQLNEMVASQPLVSHP
ncbi:hypothetical protein PGT21_005872 [Puccinia graminis f. sp. tritici]|nr:hypothetical protein PGT21_006887 [Puccinia graminis f. sp. tritici]KAA1085401.1 hypothetical protein PGT21_005872 [Puccinia graminis f. sp. tritici]